MNFLQQHQKNVLIAVKTEKKGGLVNKLDIWMHYALQSILFSGDKLNQW